MKDAISAKRLHHQVLPMEISYEEGYDSEILDGLRRKGHKLTTDHGVLGFAAITAISRANGYVEAVFDPRRFGSIEIHWEHQFCMNTYCSTYLYVGNFLVWL